MENNVVAVVETTEQSLQKRKMHLSTKILIMLVVVLIVTGTSFGAWVLASQSSSIPTRIENPIPEQTLITAVEARELARDFVGGGTVTGLSLNASAETFIVLVEHENSFEVVLNATNGQLLSMTTLTAPTNSGVDIQVAETTQDINNNQSDVVITNDNSNNLNNSYTNSNVTPTPSSSDGGNLTSEQAIELARQHLISIGINNATFVYSYSDRENGILVWSIEFRYGGRDLEFYVVKATGEFLKAPTAQSSNINNSASNPTPPANNQPSTSESSSGITREEAGQIALAFSGGRLVEVSRDSWRGRPAWWVETRANGRVHEFYICMETGTILEHECEIDD